MLWSHWNSQNNWFNRFSPISYTKLKACGNQGEGNLHCLEAIFPLLKRYPFSPFPNSFPCPTRSLTHPFTSSAFQNSTKPKDSAHIHHLLQSLSWFLHLGENYSLLCALKQFACISIIAPMWLLSQPLCDYYHSLLLGYYLLPTDIMYVLEFIMSS